MNNLTLRDWLTLLGFAITLGGWIGTYAVLQSDVTDLKEERKAYNLAVMNNEMQHLIEKSKENSAMLKEIRDLLIN